VATRRAAVQATAATVGLGAVPTADIDYTDAAISELIAAWRADSVTAVAAYNDDIAATLVGAALRMGLRLPEDLAVIGHDDTPLATMLEPQLSTVHVDTAGLGRYTAALAISAATGRPAPEAGPVFTSNLIVRASTVRS
jgi:DNA-binding LacI/PurR family transcriptional regulator